MDLIRCHSTFVLRMSTEIQEIRLEIRLLERGRAVGGRSLLSLRTLQRPKTSRPLFLLPLQLVGLPSMLYRDSEIRSCSSLFWTESDNLFQLRDNVYIRPNMSLTGRVPHQTSLPLSPYKGERTQGHCGVVPTTEQESNQNNDTITVP